MLFIYFALTRESKEEESRLCSWFSPSLPMCSPHPPEPKQCCALAAVGATICTGQAGSCGALHVPWPPPGGCFTPGPSVGCAQAIPDGSSPVKCRGDTGGSGWWEHGMGMSHCLAGRRQRVRDLPSHSLCMGRSKFGGNNPILLLYSMVLYF